LSSGKRPSEPGEIKERFHGLKIKERFHPDEIKETISPRLNKKKEFNGVNWTGRSGSETGLKAKELDEFSHSELHPLSACEVYPMKSINDGYFIRVQSGAHY